MAFDPRIIEVLEDCCETRKLNILVWGPNPDNETNGETCTRTKIKEAIKSKFPRSDVKFSEEISIKVGQRLSLVLQEAIHMRACDVCIILDTSAGPASEIAVFSNTPDWHKMRIFTPVEYKDSRSFPARVRDGMPVKYFTAEEHARCRLTASILKEVKIVSVGKFLGLPI